MASMLDELSEALAKNVESTGPSVVRVEGRRRLPASGVVWSEDGLVVTANHVLKRDDDIAVGLADGQAVKATLIGRDPGADLAVLRVESGDLSPAGWLAEGMRVGHLVLALGRPGRTVQATLGIISALGDSWRTATGGQVDRYLQTDVVMYPGFSGGPLVNSDGQILGLNTSALHRGVSLTVPASTVDHTVNTLLVHGRMRRGYLGVSTQPVRLPETSREELGQETGLLVVNVEAGSPAGEGGLLLGDTIVKIDDAPIRHHDDLMSQLSTDRVGQKSPLTIIRGGEVRTLNVTIGER
ncbi:MAG: trypsin-like peptidase domain-containing protein [Candidatus Promineifilaceae bacterium]